MSNDSHAIKKCPSCGKYTEWNNQVEDKCQYCGQVLDPRSLHEKLEAEEKEKQARLKFEHPVFWVSIKPDDNPFTVFWKTILRGAQLVYMAIISFLLWVAAVVAG